MEYDVEISDTCLEEIEDICEYIEKKLKEKNVANRLRAKMRNAIKDLKYSPKVYATIGKRDRTNREYRRITVDNYIILYTIIEEDKVVLVSHAYYGAKNYLEGRSIIIYYIGKISLMVNVKTLIIRFIFLPIY